MKKLSFFTRVRIAGIACNRSSGRRPFEKTQGAYPARAGSGSSRRSAAIAALIGLLLALALAGCYYNNEEVLYNCAVDPATTRYSTTITNILTSYGCTSCHGTFAPAAGITLNTHAGVKPVAGSGMLFGAISHQPGFEPMPQGSAKMSNCDIRKIKAWIDAGAPDN